MSDNLGHDLGMFGNVEDSEVKVVLEAIRVLHMHCVNIETYMFAIDKWIRARSHDQGYECKVWEAILELPIQIRLAWVIANLHQLDN
jgi:hypothetical protein